VDYLEALASGNPKRIERRVKNRLGPGARSGWLLAVALALKDRVLAGSAADGSGVRRVSICLGQPGVHLLQLGGDHGVRLGVCGSYL
jgi:hypothetical protein